MLVTVVLVLVVGVVVDIFELAAALQVQTDLEWTVEDFHGKHTNIQKETQNLYLFRRA